MRYLELLHQKCIWQSNVYHFKEQALIKHEYNAFGNEILTTQFGTKFVCENWDVYRKPEQQLEALTQLAKYPTCKDDRVTQSQYYPSGKLKRETSSAIPYYDDEKSGVAAPVTRKKYDRFGDLVYEAKLLSPGKWAEKAIWRDASGLPVLEIDENRYVKQYIRDANGMFNINWNFPMHYPISPSSICAVFISNLIKKCWTVWKKTRN